MRVCPCEFLLGEMKASGANEQKPCTCTAPQIRRYLSRISGPLLDRIDIHIEVPRLSADELQNKRAGEPSCAVRKRVVGAREKQTKRLGKGKENAGGAANGATSCNAGMRAKELREHCEVNGSTKELLKAAINQFGLSGRGYDRILKVSRTIADLKSAERIEMHHVAEAINYRAFDRKLSTWAQNQLESLSLPMG